MSKNKNMEVSITKFTEQPESIQGDSWQHTIHDEVDHLFGLIKFNHVGCFPIYKTGEGQWKSYNNEDESWGEYEMEFNYRPDGSFTFGISGDGEDYSSFYIYNPVELKQFISFVEGVPPTPKLNATVKFKEFKASSVIKNIYVTINNNDKPVLCHLKDLQKTLNRSEFSSLLRCIFQKDLDFLVEIGNWSRYCEEKSIKTTNDYYTKTSVLYNNGFIQSTSPSVDLDVPHLAFEVDPSFSSQYFFDLMYYSKEGITFIKSLYDSLLNNNPIQSILISAPKDFVSQTIYSASFRLEHNYYLKSLTDTSNFQVEQMVDLKATCINRRQNFENYILNKENSDFLNSLKNPLPFIIDKTLRSYSRSTNDFDRQTYGGRLFNYVLRSIVIYPLQELVHLNHHETNDEITNILVELKSGKPISDGTWLRWFNDIAKTVGKNSDIKLEYFNKLIQNFQALYSDIQKSIPKRNDWAHYREHSSEYQKHIDNLLPVLLSNMRQAFEGVDFIYVEKQEYKSEAELVITAKRVMGYEVDIETIEISTSLPGHFFISNKLYSYKPGTQYTIKLEPFLELRVETVESIKMGIFDNIINGEFEYAY